MMEQFSLLSRCKIESSTRDIRIKSINDVEKIHFTLIVRYHKMCVVLIARTLLTLFSMANQLYVTP